MNSELLVEQITAAYISYRLQQADTVEEDVRAFVMTVTVLIEDLLETALAEHVSRG